VSPRPTESLIRPLTEEFTAGLKCFLTKQFFHSISRLLFAILSLNVLYWSFKLYANDVKEVTLFWLTQKHPLGNGGLTSML